MSFIVFEDERCSCPHPDVCHDDGFGCTERDCDCMAQWTWEHDDYEPEGLRL